MRRVFHIVDEGLAWIEKTFLVTALAVMCLIVFFDFFLREFFASGFVWAKELAMFLMIWVGFIGASLATRANRHLVVGIPEKLFPPNTLRYVSFSVAILVVVLTLFVAYLGWQYVMETRMFEERSIVLRIPLWYVQIIIPVSLFVIAIRFFGLGLRVLRKDLTAIGGGDVPAAVTEPVPKPKTK